MKAPLIQKCKRKETQFDFKTTCIILGSCGWGGRTFLVIFSNRIRRMTLKHQPAGIKRRHLLGTSVLKRTALSHLLHPANEFLSFSSKIYSRVKRIKGETKNLQGRRGWYSPARLSYGGERVCKRDTTRSCRAVPCDRVFESSTPTCFVVYDGMWRTASVRIAL